MANNSFKVKNSLNIEPKTSPTLNAEGDVAWNSTSHKLEIRDNSGTKSVVSEDGSATLTNKTISGSSNTLTNIPLSAASGTLPIANGGTNSTTALSNNRVIISSGSAIVEATAITASRALASDANGIPVASATTATELGYVNGVTSAIQTQVDAKVAKATLTTKGDTYVATGSATVVRQAIGSDGQVLTADSAQTNGLKWAAAPSAPSGSVTMYVGATAPTGWLLCDGSAVSRATYADLFAVCSTTYGVGDGSTTFNVPDARGVFVRGAGTQTISSINYTGTRGTTQGDQFQGHYHDIAPATTPAAYNENGGAAGANVARISTAQGVLGPITDGTNGTPRTGTETRPANISLSYIIKT